MENIFEQLMAVQSAALKLLQADSGYRLVAVQVGNGPAGYDYEIRAVRKKITKIEVDKDWLTISTGSEDFLFTEDGELESFCNAIAGRPVKLIFDPSELLPEAEALRCAILANYKDARHVTISPACRFSEKEE